MNIFITLFNINFKYQYFCWEALSWTPGQYQESIIWKQYYNMVQKEEVKCKLASSFRMWL